MLQPAEKPVKYISIMRLSYKNSWHGTSLHIMAADFLSKMVVIAIKRLKQLLIITVLNEEALYTAMWKRHEAEISRQLGK